MQNIQAGRKPSNPGVREHTAERRLTHKAAFEQRLPIRVETLGRWVKLGDRRFRQTGTSGCTPRLNLGYVLSLQSLGTSCYIELNLISLVE